MPTYAQVCRWKREHSEFRESLQRAYEDHADYLVDKVMDVTEKDNNKFSTEEVSAARLEFDALKWQAQVRKPQQYAPNLKLSGDKDAPLTLVVDTGIRRAGDVGYKVDETARLREAESAVESPLVPGGSDGE
jgi:hypothetical protein